MIMMNHFVLSPSYFKKIFCRKEVNPEEIHEKRHCNKLPAHQLPSEGAVDLQGAVGPIRCCTDKELILS